MEYPFKFSVGYLISTMIMGITIYFSLVPMVGVAGASFSAMFISAITFLLVSRDYVRTFDFFLHMVIDGLIPALFACCLGLAGRSFGGLIGISPEFTLASSVISGWILFWILHVSDRT